MQNLAKHTDRTAHSFRALKVGAAIALVAAAGAAVKFGTSSVKAYVEAQSAQVRLQDAFRKFPKLADTNQAALQRLNTELQKKTKFDDDATASGQAVLAQFKLTGAQITQLTPLLQDYAARTGKDLPTAARDLGKAVLGQGRSLKAVGIDFKDTGTHAGNLDQIMKGLRTQVGGFAEREGKSAAGQAAILKNQFGELQESVGKLLLPALTKVVGGLGRVVGFIQDNSAIFGTFAKTVKVVFGSIIDSIFGGQDAFRVFADFIATHQEGITRAIIGGGKAFVVLGKALATQASFALRAFGFLAEGQAKVVEQMLGSFGQITHGAALAFGWIPGIGAKFKAADIAFRGFAAGAVGGLRSAASGARGLADGIDQKLLPGLNKAGTGLDSMGKKAISAARARDITARAEIRHRDALDAATRAAKTNGKTLDSNTISGRSNRVALNNLVASSRAYISKLDATGASSKRVTSATATARAEFVRVATKMGLSSAAAKDLATKYFKIPTKRSTKIDQPGMTDSQRKAINYQKQLNAIHKKVSTSVGVKFGSSGKVALHYGRQNFIANATGGVLPGFTPGRDVHTFRSMSPGVPDLKLSGGEAVMRPEWTRLHGGAPGVARENEAAKQGRTVGFADGGTVPSMRPATRAPQVAERAGSAIARDAGAAVAKAAMAELKKQAAAAGGGPIGKGGYASALNYARQHKGHPYQFGTLWDCSGFMSALHSIILGQRPHRRYTTTAFHGAHAAGFTRGKSSPFRVGVRPLAGKFGHMAGTLNGVNVESSGGVGVRVGGGARGAGSGMFSWRGGLAKGGVIGDMPFDLLDPRGERYTPWLADLVHKAGYHRGGRIGGDGPERILSPRQNRAFEHLVRVMDRRGGGACTYNVTINAPNYIGSQAELKQTLVSMARRGDLAVIQR